MPPRKRLIYFLPLLLVLSYGIKRSLSLPASDFAAYYFGSREIVAGRSANAYDLEKLNAVVLADGYPGNFVAYTPFPPFTAVVFAPFLGFSMGVAKTVFNVLSCALFLFTLWRCSRLFSIPPLLIGVTPVVFFIPILNNLAFGQAYLILCSLLLEGWLAYRSEQTALAGLLWGIAILFKLTPAFLFVFLLLRRSYRQALVLAAACGLLLGLSLLVTGLPVWKFYISDVLPKMGRGELNDPFTYIFQSAFMLLKRVFLYDALLNPAPVYNSPVLFVAGMALFKALILAPVVVLTLRGRDLFFMFGAWIMASLLIAPNGSSYSLILLLIPLWALAPFGQMKVIVAMALLGLACTVAVGKWGSFPVWLQFPRLYLLLLVFILLVAQAGRIGNAWLVLGLTIGFIGLDGRTWLREKETGAYVLPKEEHLFLYDYGIKDHHLVYYYQDDKGRREQVTDIPAEGLTQDDLEIRNEQIYYKGHPLTASPDRKRKARLLDGRMILYLSDEDRGFGFYTLREISPGSPVVPLSFR